MTTIAELPTREQLDTVLNESFVKLSDGFWYPLASGVALVRIGVGPESYQIQRRRKPEAPWITLVETLIQDFDRFTFAEWASSWRLTQ